MKSEKKTFEFFLVGLKEREGIWEKQVTYRDPKGGAGVRRGAREGKKEGGGGERFLYPA